MNEWPPPDPSTQDVYFPEPCKNPPHNRCAYGGCGMRCALRHPAKLHS